MDTIPSWQETSQEVALNKIGESLERKREYVLNNAPGDVVRGAGDSLITEWISLLEERDRFTKMIAGCSIDEILEGHLHELKYVLQKFLTFQFTSFPASFQKALANIYLETCKYLESDNLDDSNANAQTSPLRATIPDVLMGTTATQYSPKNTPIKVEHKYVQCSTNRMEHKFVQSSPSQDVVCASCIRQKQQELNSSGTLDFSAESSTPIIYVGKLMTPPRQNDKQFDKTTVFITMPETPKEILPQSTSCGTQTSPKSDFVSIPIIFTPSPESKVSNEEIPVKIVISPCNYQPFQKINFTTPAKFFSTPETPKLQMDTVKEALPVHNSKDVSCKDSNKAEASDDNLSSDSDKKSCCMPLLSMNKKQKLKKHIVPKTPLKEKSPEKSQFKTPSIRRPWIRTPASKIPTSKAKRTSPIVSTPLRAPISSHKSRQTPSGRRSFEERIAMATPSRQCSSNLPLRRSLDNEESQQQPKHLKSWKTLNNVTCTPTILSPTRKLSEIAGFKSAYKASPTKPAVPKPIKQRPFMKSQIFG